MNLFHAFWLVYCTLLDNLLLVQYYFLLLHYLMDLFLLCFRCSTPAFVATSWFLCQIFFLCSLDATASFCFFFMFFSHTFFTFTILCSFIPNLTFLFFLSITKSKSLILSPSSNSSFISYPSVLLCCCSTFNLLILSLVFDHLYLLQFYFLVPTADLVV